MLLSIDKIKWEMAKTKFVYLLTKYMTKIFNNETKKYCKTNIRGKSFLGFIEVEVFKFLSSIYGSIDMAKD